MTKSAHKRLKIQSNRRTSIHRHVKVKIPKRLQQKSSRTKEATKVKAFMENFVNSDGNGHRRKKISITLHHYTNQTIRKSLRTGRNPRTPAKYQVEKRRKGKIYAYTDGLKQRGLSQDVTKSQSPVDHFKAETQISCR